MNGFETQRNGVNLRRLLVRVCLALAIVGAVRPDTGSAGVCQCCEACPGCAGTGEAGNWVCRPIRTYRWTELTAWDIRYEPVCLAGCAGFTSPAALSGDVTTGGGDLPDGCAIDGGQRCNEASQPFPLALLSSGSKTRMRKKLMRRTQQVRVPSVEYVYQRVAVCPCSQCACPDCLQHAGPRSALLVSGSASDSNLPANGPVIRSLADGHSSSDPVYRHIADVEQVPLGSGLVSVAQKKPLPPIVAGTFSPDVASDRSTDVIWIDAPSGESSANDSSDDGHHDRSEAILPDAARRAARPFTLE